MNLPVIPIGPVTGALAGWLYAIHKGQPKGNRGKMVATGALIGIGIGVYNFTLAGGSRRYREMMAARAANPGYMLTGRLPNPSFILRSANPALIPSRLR